MHKITVWNRGLIARQLEHENDDVAAEVRAAVDDLIEDPLQGSDRVIVREGRAALAGSFIAELPHQWFLTYRIEHNVPPLQLDVLRFVTLLKRVI